MASNYNPSRIQPSSSYYSDQAPAIGSLSLQPSQDGSEDSPMATSQPSAFEMRRNMRCEAVIDPPKLPKSFQMGSVDSKKNLGAGFYKMQPLLTEWAEDGSIRFNIQKYQCDAFLALNEFRFEDSLCDVVLVIEGQEIRAHKVILAACSRYFRGMFTRNMMEASSNRVNLLESSITAESMRTLVEFAYTCSLLVTERNVQSLLVAAVFLEMKHVIEACTIFLEQHLDASNCIGFASFAALHGCFDLEKKCRRYTEEHFSDVIKHDEFLTLEAQDMLNIVKKEELNIRCESEVFQAILRWVEYDLSRTCQLEYLLENVRLNSLAPCYLQTQLRKCKLLQKLPRCMKIITDRLRRLTQHRDCVDRPRKPCKPLVIYSFGGFSRKTMDSLKCAECFEPRSKEWTRVADLPMPRCGAGVAALQGLIYVLGGSTKRCGQCFDACSLSVYNPNENVWFAKCPLSMPRNRVGVGVLDNLIYAVGGSSSGEIFKSAERYDFTTDSWEAIAHMNTPRISAGVAVVNRLLYTVGGFDGVRRLRSVERFHPEQNEWQEVEPLNQARSGAGVTVLDGYIYAVGGYDGERQLTSVERYDITNRKWEEVAPLSRARSGMGIAVVGNRLYAIGGFDGRDFLSCIETYDPDNDTWHPEASMLSERSGHAVMVSIAPQVS